jgi:hypothetical protein
MTGDKTVVGETEGWKADTETITAKILPIVAINAPTTAKARSFWDR